MSFFTTSTSVILGYPLPLSSLQLNFFFFNKKEKNLYVLYGWMNTLGSIQSSFLSFFFFLDFLAN